MPKASYFTSLSAYPCLLLTSLITCMALEQRISTSAREVYGLAALTCLPADILYIPAPWRVWRSSSDFRSHARISAERHYFPYHPNVAMLPCSASPAVARYKGDGLWPTVYSGYIANFLRRSSVRDNVGLAILLLWTGSAAATAVRTR